MEQLLATVALFALLGAAFVRARRQARESAGARTRLLIRSGLAVPAGAVVVFWLPRYVPETPGSPGTLVVVALLWIFGGIWIAFGIPTFLGAFLTRPPGDEAPDGSRGRG